LRLPIAQGLFEQVDWHLHHQGWSPLQGLVFAGTKTRRSDEAQGYGAERTVVGLQDIAA
jgi:hypothetical protein